MRDTNSYSITSTYKMKLTGDLKALETSINIYRDALRMLIPIINDNWETLSEYEFTNQKYNRIEKWIHNTKNNQAVYNFDEQFPKFQPISDEVPLQPLLASSLLIVVT